MRTSDRHDLLRRRSFGICRQAKWGMTSEAKSTRVSTSFRSPLSSRSMPAPRYCRIRSICWMPDMQTKFVAANGLRFEVLEQGTGVRLALCLHGFPEHAISWRHQIPVRRSSRIPPSCAREETSESGGMPCLFLNTERGFGAKPPQKSGFRRHLAGSKMPKETFFTAISRWRVVARRALDGRSAAARLSGRGLQTRRHGQRGGDRARDLPPLCRTRLGPAFEGLARSRRDQS